MNLTRFEYKDEDGQTFGIAYHVDECDSIMIEDMIMEYGEHLAYPEPYPDNSKAYFTPSGLENHGQLIDSWKDRCESNGFEVTKIELKRTHRLNIAYEDNDQVIVLL